MAFSEIVKLKLNFFKSMQNFCFFFKKEKGLHNTKHLNSKKEKEERKKKG